MQTVLLGNSTAIQSALNDSGLVLFGLLLVAFGASFVLVILLKKLPKLFEILLGILILILFLLVGIIIIDLYSAGSGIYTIQHFAELSELLSSHRWILIQLPVILILMSIIILMVYRDNINQKYAKEYRLAVQFSVFVSFLSIIIIGFESLF